MIAISRFRIEEAEVGPQVAGLAEAAAFFRGRPGCLSAEVVQNLDDPALWALVSHWDEVGSYRRGFNGYDAKMILTPVLSYALDEPGAYAAPDEVGTNRPRAS
ncbi:MAG: antibiotic biosynthesis monooxygenase family protein [Propioniciclava sp.]